MKTVSSIQEIYTKAEAAAYLRMHPKTVQALVNTGQLKAKRTTRDKNGVASGHLRFTRQALEDYVASLPDA